jgi:hypothetical protein
MLTDSLQTRAEAGGSQSQIARAGHLTSATWLDLKIATNCWFDFPCAMADSERLAKPHHAYTTHPQDEHKST